MGQYEQEETINITNNGNENVADTNETASTEAPKTNKTKKLLIGGCAGCGAGCLIIVIIAICIPLIGGTGYYLYDEYFNNFMHSSDSEYEYPYEDSDDEETQDLEDAIEVAQVESDYNEVFEQWQECMNTHDRSRFTQLYAENVFYYGRNMTPDEVMDDKFTWFDRFPEMNDQVYNVNTTELSSDHVRIDFTYDRQKDYTASTTTGRARIEMRRFGGEWLITYENVR